MCGGGGGEKGKTPSESISPKLFWAKEAVRILPGLENDTLPALLPPCPPSPSPVIYVIPADVTGPVSHFEALQSQPASLPPAMRGAAAAAVTGGGESMFPAKDKDFAKHFLLLQDGSGAGADKR